jgi:predicted alpha/beta-hydrolase family hydrolase
VGTALREFFSPQNPPASNWISISALADPKFLIKLKRQGCWTQFFLHKVSVNRRLILFASGAGAPSSHPWMQNWKQRLSEIGAVETFDYDYIRAGRRRPDGLPQLIAAHRAALRTFANRESKCVNREEPLTPRLFLVGKSMGGRIGCHVSVEEKVDGLVCLGYPLCAMGDRTKLRDEVLRALTTPILFVQGTRDALCPLDLLEQVRAEMKAPNFLHVVEAGDHSLRVSKRQLQATGETQEDIDHHILKAIAGFVDQLSMSAD